MNWQSLVASGGAVTIGVDVCSRTMSAAQVTSQGAGKVPLLSCAMTLERSTRGAVPGEQDLRRLAEHIRVAGFAGSDVVLTAPDEMMLTAVLELPPAGGGAPIDMLALNELARVHRKDPGAIAASRWDIPSPERAKPGTYTMAVGMTHEDGEKLVAAFAQVGLRVVGIDSRITALGRMAGLAWSLRETGVEAGLAGVVDLGYSRAQLVMVHSSGAPGQAPVVVYERAIEAGGLNRVLSQMHQRLGIDAVAAHALLRGQEGGVDSPGVAELTRASRSIVSEYFESFLGEVQRSMHYAGQRYPSLPVRQVWVCGPGAMVRGIGERLGVLLQTSVEELAAQRCFAVRVGSALATDTSCMIAGAVASRELALVARGLSMQADKRGESRGPAKADAPKDAAKDTQRSAA
jgi:hypothetical protein